MTIQEAVKTTQGVLIIAKQVKGDKWERVVADFGVQIPNHATGKLDMTALRLSDRTYMRVEKYVKATEQFLDILNDAASKAPKGHSEPSGDALTPEPETVSA